MNRDTPINLEKLPFSIRKDLEEFAKENNRVLNSDLRSVLNDWLNWQGVIGFTDQILQIIEAANDDND